LESLTYATGTINDRETATADSIYDLLNPTPSAPMKARFVDGFCGDTQDGFVWGTGTYSSSMTGTITMADEVDGGIKFLTGADNYASVWMTFQGEQLNGAESQPTQQPFSPTGSVLISVLKYTTDSALSVFSSAGGGLFGGTNGGRGDQGGAAGNGGVAHQMRGNQTYFNLTTNNAGAYGSTLNTGVEKDTNWHCHKIECKTASAEYTLDGVLVGSRTDNLTPHHLAPQYGVFKYTVAGQCGMQLRYCEAYNT
jgi:hypothetical protein